MKNFSGVCQAAGADKPLRAFFIWITNIVTLTYKKIPRCNESDTRNHTDGYVPGESQDIAGLQHHQRLL